MRALIYITLIQQITTFYEDNFPEVMKNILVIKGAFPIFLNVNYLYGQMFPLWLAKRRQNFDQWK